MHYVRFIGAIRDIRGFILSEILTTDCSDNADFRSIGLLIEKGACIA